MSKSSSSSPDHDILVEILDTMQDAILSFSLVDRRFIYASPSIEETLGYPLRNFGENLDFYTEIVHPDDLEPARKARETALLDGFAEFEHRVIWPNGQVRWLYHRAWVNYDEQRAPIRINEVLRDITERKQAESALKHQEENLSTLFHSIRDFLFVLDMQGNIREVNQPVIERIGYSRKELVNQPVLVVYPPERRTEAAQNVAEMLQGQRDYYAVPIQTKAGDLIPVETYITQGMWDGQPALFGVSKDISALKMSEEKFASAFHDSPVIMGLSALETGEYVEVNQAFCEKLGFTQQEVIGRQSVDVIRLDNQYRQRVITKLQSQGYVENEEATIYTKNGDPLAVILTAKILLLNNKRYNFTAAVDISDRKRIEAALRQSNSLFNSFMEHFSAGTFIQDSSGRIHYCNTWNARSFNMSPDEIAGKTPEEYTTPQMAQLIRDENRRLIESGQETMEFEYTGKRNGATHYWRIFKFLIPQESGLPLIGGIAINQTKEKQAEITLQTLNEQLEQHVAERTTELERAKDRIEAIFNHSADGILLLDVKRGIQQANYAFESLFQLSGDDYFGKRLRSYFHPDNRDSIGLAFEQVTATHETQQIEVRGRRKDGSHFDVEISIAPVNRSHQAVASLVCIIRDVSERKRMERELTEKYAELDRFFTVALDLLSIADTDGKFVKLNKTWETTLGYPIEQLEGRKFLDFVHPDDMEATLRALTELAEQKQVINFVNRYRTQDGRYRLIEWRSHPHGRLIYSAARDITERVRSEEELRHSEQRLKMTIDGTQAGTWEWFVQTGETTFNERWAGIAGYTLEELAPINIETWIKLTHPDDLKVSDQRLEKHFSRELDYYDCEVRMKHKDGHWVWVWDRGKVMEWTSEGKPLRMLGTHLDISAIKTAQQTIAEERNLLRAVIDTVPDFIYIRDREHRYNLCNLAYARFHGYADPTELNGKSVSDLFSPENAAKFQEENEQVIKTGHSLSDIEDDYTDSGGKHAWVLTNKVPVRNLEDEVTGVLCITHDVTRIKNSEEALRKSEEALRKSQNMLEIVLNTIPVRVFWKDKNLNYLGCNKLFAADVGLDNPKAIIGKQDTQLPWMAGHTEGFNTDDLAVISSGVPHLAYEEEMLIASGGQIHAQTSKLPLWDEDDNIIGVLGMYVDISERKQAEDALRKNAAEIEDLYNNAPCGYHSVDATSLITRMNDTELKWLGYTNEEVVGKLRFKDIITPDCMQRFAENFPLFKERGWMNDIEFELIRKDGSIMQVLLSATALYDEDGSFIASRSTAFDITDRKQAEIALRESEERYRTTISAMSEGIVMYDASGAIQVYNAAAESILGLTKDQMMGRTSVDPRWQAVHKDNSPFLDETHPAMVTLRTGEPQYNVTMGVHKPTGELAWISINSQAVIEAGGTQPSAVVATFKDITEQRLAEEMIRKQQEEERQMQAYLKALHEISIHLTRVETLDEFYRSVIQEGLAHFGFERMGLLLYDTKTREAVGTYGTDPQGNLVDEHHQRFNAAGLTGILRRAMDRRERFAFDEKVMLYSDFKPIGTGQNAAATLWNGEALGWLAIDNAIQQHPISKTQLDVLALYAMTVGSLLARKRAEFALRESEQRYRLLAENVKDVIVKQTIDTTITFITPSSYSLAGYQPEELIGRSGLLLVHPDDQPVSQRIAVEAIESGKAFFSVTERLLHKDGHYIWIEATYTIVYDPVTRAPHELIGLAHDITERRAAEEALRKSEEKFRLFIEAAPLACVISDSTGKITLINSEAEKLFGYERQELIGQTIEFLVPETIRGDHRQRRHEFQSSKEHQMDALELSVQRKDGSIFPADIQLTYIDVDSSQMAMSFVMDITERKRVETVLKQALLQEKELGDLKTRFVSMASHEFRTPLASILATTETLTIYRERMDQDQIDARLDKIRQHVAYMKGIMEEVLQLARIQARRVEFQPEPGDIHLLCHEIIEEFESQIPYHNRIRYTCITPPVTTDFDVRLMRQIISNLISNALKYSPDSKQIEVSLSHDEDQITLQVQDEGIGIPEDDLKHLFEPFHRARNVGTISGTGLGLSIAKQAVELHQGIINTISQVDEGTTFIVIFPKGTHQESSE
ncbi:MAG: PAS domain S-box protein [Anaerolineaceae bacterium]|nr:PAS domain S-box protein [Anaerolineaceae bacterium]